MKPLPDDDDGNADQVSSTQVSSTGISSTLVSSTQVSADPGNAGRGNRGRALYEEIKARVIDGTYAAGSALPSTRACAAERGLSRTTVSAVYEQLAAEGYIDTRPGSASRVAEGVMVSGAGSGASRRPQAPPQAASARTTEWPTDPRVEPIVER